VNEFGQLTAIPGVVSSRGATDAEFDVFEAQTGLTLPADVRKFYQHTNGLTIDRGNRMRIHSLEEVANFVESFQQFGIPSTWGYFPFTDRNDSNPNCVCCEGPVTGYVVRVNHDDIAHIEYRSVGSFLAAVRNVLESPARAGRGRNGEAGSLRNLPQDFYPDTSDRTPEDVETAHGLLALAGSLGEGSVEQADAVRWAITLLSQNEVDEIARLLDTGDGYRREEAIAKLSPMTAPEAQAAIQRHRREMRGFVNRSVAALREAGIEVAEIQQDRARLEPGRIWFDLPAFFHRRHSPSASADLVQRARELIALRAQGNA
jgi:hypothetical protein